MVTVLGFDGPDMPTPLPAKPCADEAVARNQGTAPGLSGLAASAMTRAAGESHRAYVL